MFEKEIKKCGLEAFKLANILNGFSEKFDKLDRYDFEIMVRKLEDRLIEFSLACKVDIDDILNKDIPKLFELHHSSISAELLFTSIEEKIKNKLKS